MKYIKNFFSFLMLFSVLLFTSCNQDQEGPTYTPDNEGLSFTFHSFELSAPATDPVISIPVYRNNSNSDFTSSVTLTNLKDEPLNIEGLTADSNVTFKAGEFSAEFKVNLGSKLAVGQSVKFKVVLNEPDTSVGGVPVATITAYKEYVFKSLGKGKFVDNWASGKVYEVEILKAEGYDRYRVMDPYLTSLKNDDGEFGDWIALNTRCPFIEFWEVDNNILLFKAFAIGVNYEGAGSQPIVAHHPAEFQGQPIEHNKRLDEKTFQLAPYYYIDGLGGFPMHTMDGVILIQLP